MTKWSLARALMIVVALITPDYPVISAAGLMAAIER